MSDPYRTSCPQCEEKDEKLHDLKTSYDDLLARFTRLDAGTGKEKFVGFLVALVILAVIGTIAVPLTIWIRKPSEPTPCADAVYRMKSDDGINAYHCTPGASVTTEQVQGSSYVLVKCTCAKMEPK